MSDKNKSHQTPEGNEEILTPKGTEEETTSKENTSTEEGTPKEEVDYKQKFSDSKEEGIRLLHEGEAKDQKITDLETKLAKANEISSEKELSMDTPDWDLLSDSEKSIVKRQAAQDKEIQKMKEKEAWNDDLVKAKQWAKDNDYSLVDKETEFKTFCYSEENRGVKNIVTLVKSFLFDEKKEVKKKPIGLEKPTGGEHVPPKGGKITVEEAARIRTTNPRLYKKMLLEGRIKAHNIGE